jgi:hypothetical protein
MAVYEAIESGGECERFAPVLAALAAGTASSAQVVEIRPHLRHCTACRATVRELHISFLRRVQLLLPEVVVRRQDDLAQVLLSDGGERVRPPSWLRGLAQRLSSSDLATGIQLSLGGGGGRLGALAALAGFCLSGVGAATVCVVSGLMPNPLERPPVVRADRVEPRAVQPRAPVVVATSPRASETPVATATPPPRRGPAPPRERSQRRDPDAHRAPPISPVAETATSEFAFEQSSGGGAEPPPASAPATGGNEFTP